MFYDGNVAPPYHMQARAMKINCINPLPPGERRYFGAPNENRKIRPKGSQIPIKLLNISKFFRMINPTKKKSIPATNKRNTAAVTIGRVYPNF
jgi:hypothetical protein